MAKAKKQYKNILNTNEKITIYMENGVK